MSAELDGDDAASRVVAAVLAFPFSFALGFGAVATFAGLYIPSLACHDVPPYVQENIENLVDPTATTGPQLS
jgi:hypothetical protein